MPVAEVVITNWRRPNNVSKILEEFREQDLSCAITVVDAGGEDYSLAPSVRNLADNVYTLSRNYGPFNRYVPLANYNHEYTYFHDDDMLPGKRLMSHFVAVADSHPNGALFGQQGRNVGDVYRPLDVPRQPHKCVPVDMVVRGYFVRTEYLYGIVRFRNKLAESVREDDMLLAWSIRTFSNKGIFITPSSDDAEERMNKAELEAPHALSSNPNHLSARSDFWKKAQKISGHI